MTTKTNYLVRPPLVALVALAVAMVATLVVMLGLLAGRAAHADTTFTVTNTNDSGPGSLRQAITDANTTQGADTITFNIPKATDPGCDSASGVCSISPATNLPIVTDTVTIDGYTQPDSLPNTLASGDDAVIKVELDGTNQDFGNGLSLLGPDSTGSDSSNSVIRGLVINDFDSSGISLGGNGNTIEGNFIGTDPSGTEKEGNFDGVDVGGTNNIVGGTSPAARNIISGNGENGVVVAPQLDRNLLSRNKIWGNYIGTNKDGTKPLGNAIRGVWVRGSSGNTIGGLKSEKANKIAFNRYNGVLIQEFTFEGIPANGNRVLRNSIYSNGELGIDLEGDGPTPNDNKDRDEGPNTLQNNPRLTSAATTGTKITIQGHLRSTPNDTFTIRFFANRASEPRGYEGRTYLGTKSVSTDANGEVSFTKTLSAKVNAGQRLTATATGPGGNTSEFSAPQKVVKQ
jgi:hypothetical protein